MEYQFSYDFLGNPIAKCELECEAFGDWLSHDIAVDTLQIQLLLSSIEKLQNQKLITYQFVSKEYHLQLDKDEAELMLNNNEVANSQDKQQQDFQENANTTGCGLIDLKNLLNAWLTFIN